MEIVTSKGKIKERIENCENLQKTPRQDNFKEGEGRSYKEEIYIGSLNVRGCCQNRKRTEIDEELHLANIDIAVLQEANVQGSRVSTQHYDWILSDRGNTNNMRGLAILIRKDGKVGIREVRDIDKNIMSAIMEHKEQAEDWLIVNVHTHQTQMQVHFMRS